MTPEAALAADLIRKHEALRRTVYDDKTGLSVRQGEMLSGRPTIGYGRLLDIGRGITVAEAEYLLSNDLAIDEDAAKQFAGGACWARLSIARRAVLIDMAHNLGAPRLHGFVVFRRALQVDDYDVAALEMLNSLWASQVGERARRLAAIMKAGETP